MKILVAGSLNIDLVIKVDRLPNEGETVLGQSLIQLIGGKGTNQASAIIRQDVETTLWGVLGNDDFGSYIINEIQKIGINTALSQGINKTGTAIIETNKNGKNRIIVIPGANEEFTISQAKKNISLLDEHDILVMQFEIPIKTIEFLAKEAKKRNKIVIINPAPALPISDTLLNNIDYIIPNEHELSIITNMPTQTEEQIIKAVSKIKNKIPHIIVTLGEKGVYVSSKDFTGIINGYPMQVVDTTGAGDAFIGAFASAIIKDLSIAESVHYANISAAISVTKVGAFAVAGTEQEILKYKQ